MKFTRKFNPNQQWKTSLIIFLIFLAYVGAIVIPFNLFLLMPGIRSLGERNLAIGLLIVANILLFFPLFAIIRATWKKRNPYEYYSRQERAEFQKKFRLSTKKLEHENKKINHKIILWQIIFLLVAGGLILIINQFEVSSGVIDGLFVVIPAAFAGVWIYILKKWIFPKYAAFSQGLMKLMNEGLKDTRLELHQDNQITHIGRLVDANFNMDFKGALKGKSCELSSRSSQFGSTTTAKVHGKHPHAFTLEEKDKRWMEIEGQDLKECFGKRFELNGIKFDELSADFVEKMMHYKRNVHLIVGKESISASIQKDHFSPFYTLEGAVLFVDFLGGLSGELNSSH